MLIQQLHETGLVLRLVRKLDKPLVGTALHPLGIDWGSRIVEHLGTCFLCRQSDGMVGIMDHQFLAEGINETASAPRDFDFDGVELLDGHRVAQAVAPQAVSGCDNQLVGAALFDFPDGIDLGRLAVNILDGDELIEHTHVEQQQHCLAFPVTLHGKEALAGIIGVQEVHLVHVTDGLILLAVRRKSDASVEEDFQIGP